MIGNTVVRKAVQVEYAVLRAPLTVLDQQVLSRYFDDTSVVRVSFERGLEAFDSAAARLLEEAPEPGKPDTLPEEEQHEVAELADELLEQEETETFSGELADEDMRRVQAELRAKHTVEEQAEHSGDSAP